MSSWAPNINRRIIPKANPILKVIHNNSGFFSCCSFQLHMIVEYFNRHKKLPEIVDSSEQFDWYRPGTMETYFTTESSLSITIKKRVDYEHHYQYLNYKKLDYKGLAPFIVKYFTPSSEIKDIMAEMELKYPLDYANTCCLFYRGNDKATETALSSYSDYIVRAKAVLQANPKTQFLVQSDETEFIETMVAEFPNRVVWFKDEIRHIRKSVTTVDKVFQGDNYRFSKYFLAITLIMAKCGTIICGTGNCSIWIALFRGNAEGMQQFLNRRWL